MPDRKTTINALNHTLKLFESHSLITVSCNDFFTMMLKDALDLLKEQEEKQIPKPIIHGDKEEYWGEEEICPDCGKRWQSADIDTTHYCPGCGRSVIWND